MKKDILDAMNYINPDFIEEAEKSIPTKKKTIKPYLALASCLCFLALGVLGFAKLYKPVTSQKTPANESELYIEPIEFSGSSGHADMIGLVVYNSRVYTQNEVYEGKDAEKFKALLGEYIGKAFCNITEETGIKLNEEVTVPDLCANFNADIYKVKGYNSDFRICGILEHENGDICLSFYENLNGITISKGKDIFQDRLNLQNNIKSVSYQSYNDWNYDKGNIKKAEIDDSTLNTFLSEINENKFSYMWNGDFKNTIYDTEKQLFLYLTMNDGTRVTLRLIDGGYVGYEGLGWYFVKIPDDAFQPVFNKYVK